jgi:hypothetical protein
MVPALRGANDPAATRRPGEAAPDGLEVSRLHEVQYRKVHLTRVPAAFSEGAPTWLGQPIGSRSDGAADFACDMELRVSPEGRALFRKSAIVTIGQPRHAGESWVVPIEWRAATLAPLFPVFVGSLTIMADRIAIDGHYAPPFGVVGVVLDRAVLAIAARATARWFLAKVALAVA